MTIKSPEAEFLTIQEFAALIKVPVNTVYTWRAASPARGPRGLRIGKHVRYAQVEIDR